MMPPRLVIAALALALSAGAPLAAETKQLTDEEKAAGWILLFDGTSAAGWHAIGKTEFPAKGWKIEDGALKCEKGGGGGDIVTERKFGDFELAWEWRVAEGANSGVKYNLPDPAKAVGCEYQLLDDERHPDANAHGTTRRTGGLYDVLSPAEDAKPRPATEWNESRIIVIGNHVEHFLNGRKTVGFDFESEALKAAIVGSKFKGTKGWGIKTASPILLQDHGDEVAFRNVKLRELAEK